MTAYIDAVCFVDRSLNLSCIFNCHGREYFLKSALPCSQRLIGADGYISIGEILLGHFTDHSVSDRQLAHFVSRNFCNNRTKSRCKCISRIQVMLHLHTKLITKSHLAHCRNDSISIQCISGHNLACFYIFEEFSILITCFLVIRQIIFVTAKLHQNDLIACFLELRCNDMFIACNIYCKGYQSRRYVNIIECTGHTVLSSDGRQSESKLCTVCTKKCCKRLTPTMRIFCHSAEVFLEGKTDLAVISTGRHDSCHRLQYSINCAVIR